MYCPKCQAEFREGFTYCTTCNENLVDSLPEVETIITQEQYHEFYNNVSKDYLDKDENLVATGDKENISFWPSFIYVTLGAFIFFFLFAYIKNHDLKVALTSAAIALGIIFIYTTFLLITSSDSKNNTDNIYITNKRVIIKYENKVLDYDLKDIQMISAGSKPSFPGSHTQNWFIRLKTFENKRFTIENLIEESAQEIEEKFTKWSIINEKDKGM